MPLPTRSACSAEASPGGQISKAGATVRLERTVDSEGVVACDGAAVEGSPLERPRLGGVASDMMLVDGAEAGKVAVAPGLAPVMLGCAVLLPVVLAAVAVAAAAPMLGGLAGEDEVGKGIAPEVALSGVPGGGGGGPVVVVATVEGEVEGVLVAVVEDADCARAEPASPRRTAAASVRVPSFTAIAAPR